MPSASKSDDLLHSSGSTSDLSALEDDTDEFGRVLIQHRRERRLQIMATANGDAHPQAFRKARPRLSQRLKRDHVPDDGIVDELQDDRKTSNPYGDGSHGTLPVASLQDWGRRAKKQPDWMKRIPHSDDRDYQAGNSVMVNEAAKPSYARDIDHFRVDLENPIRSIETTPPPNSRREQGSPSSLRHMHTSMILEPSIDDPDFSTGSLLASTPPAPRSHSTRTIDEPARREFNSIDRQSKTNENFDRTFERSPNRTLQRQQKGDVRESKTITENKVTTLAEQNGATSPRIPRRRSLIGNKENVRPGIRDGYSGFKGAQTVAVTDYPAAGAVNITNVSRPGHRRNESMNLLKRLARVSSMSPSPQQQRLLPHNEDLERQDRRAERKSTEGRRGNGMSKRKLQEEAGTQRSTTSRERSRVSKGGTTHHAETAIEIDDSGPHHRRNTEAGEEQLSDEEGVCAKTPAVTGGWIDTPKVAKFQESNDDTNGIHTKNNRGKERASKAPNDPVSRRTEGDFQPTKSALSGVFQDEIGLGESRYGESTLASLENLIHTEPKPTDGSLARELEKIAQKNNAFAHDALDRVKVEDRESTGVEDMDKHFRAAQASVKDASRSLRNAEDRVGETISAEPENADNAVSNGPHGRTICRTCGHVGYTSVWQALWVELRENFYTYDSTHKLPSPLNVRLTWLGLLTAVFLNWLVSEWSLCVRFCHPDAATRMVGYGVDPDAPIFPFVIPTLLFRPIRWIWRPVLDAVGAGLAVLWQEMLGDNAVMAAAPAITTDRARLATRLGAVEATQQALTGFDWARTTAGSAAAGVSRVAQSIVDAIDETGSMWDDQVL